MIIVGEKLNSSIPKTYNAMIKNDIEYLKELAIMQADCGSHYLDINTSICGSNELEKMLIILELVQSHTNCGIMLDSPSPDIIIKAIPFIKNRNIIINSLTISERLEELIPVIIKYNCGIVGLPIDVDGIPSDATKEIDNCNKLIKLLTDRGIDESKIFIDVLAQSVALDDKSALNALKTIHHLSEFYPDVHSICGLSNISYGLPKRVNINNAFLSLALYEGLDSVIMDITNATTKQALYASLAVCGKDEYCLDYLNIAR